MIVALAAVTELVVAERVAVIAQQTAEAVAAMEAVARVKIVATAQMIAPAHPGRPVRAEIVKALVRRAANGGTSADPMDVAVNVAIASPWVMARVRAVDIIVLEMAVGIPGTSGCPQTPPEEDRKVVFPKTRLPIQPMSNKILPGWEILHSKIYPIVQLPRPG